MSSTNKIPFYASQYSLSSVESNDTDFSSVTLEDSEIQYEPMQARGCRKPAPTLATGRRSKHLILDGDEAVKREKRREKNRDAARKLKEKRQVIEEKLNEKLKQLELENVNLQTSLEQLQKRKADLQGKLSHMYVDPIEELLSNYRKDVKLFFEQYSDDFNHYDESIENILNFDLHSQF